LWIESKQERKNERKKERFGKFTLEVELSSWIISNTFEVSLPFASSYTNKFTMKMNYIHKERIYTPKPLRLLTESELNFLFFVYHIECEKLVRFVLALSSSKPWP
jgi:hypothetical protein